MLARASQRNGELPSVHRRSDVSRNRRELMSARATLVKARRAIALSIKSWLRGRLVVLRGRASSTAFCDAVRKAALEHEEGLPASVEILLMTFEHLCHQLEDIDRSIVELVEQDTTCKQLMEIPGVGPQVSLGFVTYIDDPHRFETAAQLGSYLALVPGEATTGGMSLEGQPRP